jgi:hypothetical protein
MTAIPAAPRAIWASPRTAIPDGFRGAAKTLTVADIDRVALSLTLEAKIVWAVATVESLGHGFIPADGRPELLYEAHKFSQFTGGAWDASHPNISSPTWDPSLYGAAGAHQYDRLAEAMALNREAALQAATWGMFQLLGTNCALVGFPDVDSLVAAMCDSEGAHLTAFAAYCQAQNLVHFLAGHDWEHFKLGYNGTGTDDYAAKLATAYASVVYPPPGMPAGPTPAPPPPASTPTPPPPAQPPVTDPVAAALATLTSERDHLSINVGLLLAKLAASHPDPQGIATEINDIAAQLRALSDSIRKGL